MVTGPLAELLARNKKLAETYQAPPGMLELAAVARSKGTGVIVLSCCDPRLNPYQILGVDSTFRPTMIRNGGGRVFDAIRTIVALQAIGRPGTIAVMHHTDCGLMHFHDADIKKDLIELAPEEKEAIEASNFGEITGPVEDSIREDLALLRASPLIRKETQIVGLKFDIATGELSIVEEL